MELKSTLLKVFLEAVLPLLLSAIGTGAVWLIVQAGKWLASSPSKLAKALLQVNHLVELVVADLNATLVPRVKAAAADGKITPEEGRVLRAEAIARVKALLGKHGLETVQKVLGVVAPQIDAYLGAAVEKAVAVAKSP